MSKIKILIEESYYEEYGENRLGSQVLTLFKDDIKMSSYSVNEGEPEDMHFGRDLEQLNSIESMLLIAYEAGKNNDEIIFETINVSE